MVFAELIVDVHWHPLSPQHFGCLTHESLVLFNAETAAPEQVLQIQAEEEPVSFVFCVGGSITQFQVLVLGTTGELQYIFPVLPASFKIPTELYFTILASNQMYDEPTWQEVKSIMHRYATTSLSNPNCKAVAIPAGVIAAL